MPNRKIPCVLMRAGTSRGPFFLREWLPLDEQERDQALIGAIGASDPLQLDGLGGNSTLNSKVAIVSRSTRPGCDLDYLFAQVGVGHQSVDTRPNCGNMLAGVAPFAIEQGLVPAQEGSTTVRIHNVNTGATIESTVCTPGRQVTYEGEARIDGVAGTAAPILLNFLDAWGAVTGQVFPTGRRIDVVDGLEVTCIDAAMPLMILRASDLGVGGRERPAELDANTALLERIEKLRILMGARMGLGDVTHSVIPKPVLVSPGDHPDSIVSRYFTPHKCHASHAVTGAIGVSTAFALPGTVASGVARAPGRHRLSVVHPQGQIDVEVEVAAQGEEVAVVRAALVRTARKIMQGELHLPDYVFPARTAQEVDTERSAEHFPQEEVRIIVPTSAGGGNDTMARILTRKLGPGLGHVVSVENRTGANGSVAAEYVAASRPDGHTLMFGYIATHGINPVLQTLRYDPIRDFAPVGLVGYSPTVLVVNTELPVRDVSSFIRLLQSSPAGRLHYAAAGEGTIPHLAAEMFLRTLGVQGQQGFQHAGAAPAISATVRGQSHWMFPSLFSALPYLKSGKLRPLAVASATRLSAWPGVPTLAESGIPDLDLTQWYALFAPAGTPEPIVRKLNQVLNQVLEDPEVRARMEQDGAQVQTSTPEQLLRHVRTELERWQGLVRTTGLLQAQALELAQEL
ncbi:4-oxalomesaconate tautomerase [Rhodoferax sp. BAB1]|uniref:4-oxalomesaconate tautomerase n=1 Tax=Rhodoferax sp. BAB1 TaxID=2741720 RepID=UPI001576A646|nr:4-oxalomesaconate tautomerase [Rhodoferax sp. BAB1]QKO20461.1 4-oxalomesaconate tautomerase [Rhodoferax sp. BAB1]